MKHDINVITGSKNTIDFDVSVTGIPASKIAVYFVVELDEYQARFECKSAEGDTWSVTLPEAMSKMVSGHKYTIDVIADGFYFTPVSGKLVSGTKPTVKVSTKATKASTTEPPKEKKNEGADVSASAIVTELGATGQDDQQTDDTMVMTEQPAEQPANVSIQEKADERVRKILGMKTTATKAVQFRKGGVVVREL